MPAQLHFTERQATAILEMRLYRLIGLEIQALRKEYEETMNRIQTYSRILEDRGEMAKVIIRELKEIQKEYGRERRDRPGQRGPGGCGGKAHRGDG